MATIWDRPEPPDRPAPTPLSRDRIVRAAIDLADAHGLEAVSLRKVAAALDAGPMRLYGYLSTKDDLLDLMVDAIYAEIAPPTGDGWRPALRSLAHGTRRAALRHEWFADLLGGRPHLGPHALAHLEATLSAVTGPVAAVERAVGTVTAYVVGAIRQQVVQRRAERASGLSERQWQVASGPYLRQMLATGRYPMVAAFVRDGPDTDPETAFEAGLECVLDGVAGLFSS